MWTTTGDPGGGLSLHATAHSCLSESSRKINYRALQSLLILVQVICVEVFTKTSLFAEGFDDKLVPVYTSAKYFVQSRH